MSGDGTRLNHPRTNPSLRKTDPVTDAPPNADQPRHHAPPLNLASRLSTEDHATPTFMQLPGPDRTVPRLLQLCAASRDTTPVLRMEGQEWRASELIAIAGRRAGALQAAGLRRGDRLALLCSNRFELLELVLGCSWLGVIAVPINTASRGMQLQHILANTGAKILALESDLMSALTTLDLTQLPLERLWLLDTTPPAHDVALPTSPLPQRDAPIPPAKLGPGDPFVILYTSGTSGPSKGVVCPHAQFYWWGVHTARKLGVKEGDVLYNAMPLFHTNALNTVFQALVSGATAHIGERFSTSQFFDSLAATGASVTYLLGAMVPMLLGREPSPAEKAHHVRIALAPGVPPELHHVFFERTGIRLLDGFGSTETNYVLARGINEQRLGWMGQVSEGFEAKVVDENDEAVPDGVAGELVLRADEPYAFALGYFNMPDKTVEAWRNLWFHTGDLVVRGPDGYFRFVDRLKDSIRRRGENISSYEVEQALMSHPAVKSAAVYAVKSELAEDEVMATVVLRSGVTLPPEDLLRYCEPRLPYFALPRFIEFADTLPITENGKIQKYKLRERGISDQTWDREKAGYKIRRK